MKIYANITPCYSYRKFILSKVTKGIKNKRCYALCNWSRTLYRIFYKLDYA